MIEKEKTRKKEKKQKKKINKKEKTVFPSLTFSFSPRKGKRAIVYARALFFPVFGEDGKRRGKKRQVQRPQLVGVQLRQALPLLSAHSRELFPRSVRVSCF